MTKSAGILVYRRKKGPIEVFLLHQGGPFWAKKDFGAWSIPKGEFEEGEDALAAAKREFKEETGLEIADHFFPLSPIKQKSGKVIHIFATEGDLDEKKAVSNTFEMEWPARSGKIKKFPENDKAEWFSLEVAKQKISSGQVGFLLELEEKIKN